MLTASFLYGSAKLYAWVDRNPRVQVLRTETTNAPALIAANPAMTSINTALQVDLFGQANASRIDARIHSGFGGQTDFIVGALHSLGGQALMALRSWHPKADVSTIVAMVDEPVTSFQHTAVVTEQGVAPMFGHDERTQARHLIEQAAHPMCGRSSGRKRRRSDSHRSAVSVRTGDRDGGQAGSAGDRRAGRSSSVHPQHAALAVRRSRRRCSNCGPTRLVDLRCWTRAAARVTCPAVPRSPRPGRGCGCRAGSEGDPVPRLRRAGSSRRPRARGGGAAAGGP